MILEVLLVVLLMVYLYIKYGKALTPPTPMLPVPPPPDKDIKMCRFLYSDIENEHTYSLDGSPITDPSLQVDCTTCDRYVYKNIGGCTRYSNFDPGYSVSSSDSGVCSTIEFSTACDKVFVKKTPQTK